MRKRTWIEACDHRLRLCAPWPFHVRIVGHDGRGIQKTGLLFSKPAVTEAVWEGVVARRLSEQQAEKLEVEVVSLSLGEAMGRVDRLAKFAVMSAQQLARSGEESDRIQLAVLEKPLNWLFRISLPPVGADRARVEFASGPCNFQKCHQCDPHAHPYVEWEAEPFAWFPDQVTALHMLQTFCEFGIWPMDERDRLRDEIKAIPW